MTWLVEPRLARNRRYARMLHRAQGGLCAGCGKPVSMDLPPRHADAKTIDHIVALSRGGRDGLGNLVLMHRACNAAKGDDVPTGCEAIWLLAVNCRLGVGPGRW